jgi:excisionase family DNA binding protein
MSGPLSLTVSPQLVDALAKRVAALLAEQAPAPPTPYLDVEQAAAYLNRPKSRMYELVAQKRVRHYRDGRALLFKHADLDEFLTHVEREAA